MTTKPIPKKFVADEETVVDIDNDWTTVLDSKTTTLEIEVRCAKLTKTVGELGEAVENHELENMGLRKAISTLKQDQEELQARLERRNVTISTMKIDVADLQTKLTESKNKPRTMHVSTSKHVSSSARNVGEKNLPSSTSSSTSSSPRSNTSSHSGRRSTADQPMSSYITKPRVNDNKQQVDTRLVKKQKCEVPANPKVDLKSIPHDFCAHFVSSGGCRNGRTCLKYHQKDPPYDINKVCAPYLTAALPGFSTGPTTKLMYVFCETSRVGPEAECTIPGCERRFPEGETPQERMLMNREYYAYWKMARRMKDAGKFDQ